MKKAILLSLLALSAHAVEPYNSFIEKWEGRRYGVYIDSTGHPSIGVGFNLKSAEGTLKELVKAQDGSLSDGQINYWLEREVLKAQNIARKNFESFDFQPLSVKLILVDLCYNLGNKIEQFVKFKEAIESYDYKLAAAELMNSKWYKQVGKRARHHCYVLNSF